MWLEHETAKLAFRRLWGSYKTNLWPQLCKQRKM